MDLVSLILGLVLMVPVLGYLDARVRWPRPNDKTRRYVSIAERSKTLRRD